jgi:hypothetical protein
MSTASLAPQPYDLDDPAEIKRLLQECAGYLNTCKRDHHGTDFLGRQFAMVALHRLASRDVSFASGGCLTDVTRPER